MFGDLANLDPAPTSASPQAAPLPTGLPARKLPSVFEFPDYRAFLKGVLELRQKRNTAYSLRSFARGLSLPASYLSDVIRGRKNFSSSKAAQIAIKLGLCELEREAFLLLVQLAGVFDAPTLKASLETRLHSLKPRALSAPLDLSIFEKMSEWYHVAILEMTALEDFDSTPEGIAKRLGLEVDVAANAVAQLEALGLVERDVSGRLVKKKNNGLFSSDTPHSALRRFHRQMLEKAADSLETQSNLEKFVGSQTFSINEAQLPEARRIIEECFDRLVALFAQSPRKNQTYHFAAQLFRLTQKEGVLLK